MNAETIDHVTLARLVEAGAVRGAHAVGQPGGWAVIIKYGMAERALAAQRSRQVRLFRKLETLVTYLKGIGLARFDVDAASFDAASVLRTRRPDRADALKRAHAAAAYDAWVRVQVQVGLDDLKAGRTVSEEAHKANWTKQRAVLVERIDAAKA